MLGATYELCKTGDPDDAVVASVRQAGQNAALSNGFDDTLPDQAVTVRVGKDSTDAANFTTAVSGVLDEYVEVEIWSDVTTYLIHLVYPGPSEVDVTVVGRCQPETNASSGFAMCATNPNPDGGKGLQIGGSGTTITMCYGDAWTNATGAQALFFGNGTTRVSCDPTECYEHVPESYDPATCSAEIGTPGGADGTGTVSPAPTTGSSETCDDNLVNLDYPTYCGSSEAQITSSGTYTVGSSGVRCFNGLRANNSSTNITLQGPGVFYFTGNWTQTNGVITVNDAMVFMDNGADFDASGGVLYMRAMKPESYPDELYAGMALFVHRSTSGDVKFTAGSSKTIFGTIYGGEDLELSMEGGADDLLVAQLISGSVKLSGQSDLRLYYDEDWFFTFPPELEIGS